MNDTFFCSPVHGTCITLNVRKFLVVKYTLNVSTKRFLYFDINRYYFESRLNGRDSARDYYFYSNYKIRGTDFISLINPLGFKELSLTR